VRTSSLIKNSIARSSSVFIYYLYFDILLYLILLHLPSHPLPSEVHLQHADPGRLEPA